MNSLRYIGAHVSTAGGLNKAIDRSIEMGANACQIFSGSPRVWARKPLDETVLQKFNEVRAKTKFGPVVTHSLYLVNLASDSPTLLEKSINALVYDMKFDAQIGGQGIVVHVGSHQGKGWAAVKELVLKSIAKVISQSPAQSHFLIENSAGQNGKIGSDLAEIKWLIDELKSDQVGWCMDTCHAFCAGYSLGTKTQIVSKPELQRERTLEQEISHYNLWSRLRSIHGNDAKDPAGSGRDRHENLGDGLIPKDDYAYFVNLPEVKSIPILLEVPGLDGNGPDKANIDRLKKILG